MQDIVARGMAIMALIVVLLALLGLILHHLRRERIIRRYTSRPPRRYWDRN